MKKTILVSFFYPAVLPFLEDYVNAIRAQSYQDFDILLFNDGVENLENILSKNLKHEFEIKTKKVEGSPSLIRFSALQFLKSQSYDFVIFQDADDFMDPNRIESCVSKLDQYPLVVNDLSIYQNATGQKEKSVWKDRLGEEFEFDYNFIQDKNIVGFGNTSIQINLLSVEIKMPRQEVLVADWFLFYQLLAQNKITALFHSHAATIYRQHEDNLVGLGDFDQEALNWSLQVKKNHYMSLNEIGYDFKEQVNRITQLRKKIAHQYAHQSQKSYHFWWEEPKIEL